MVILRELGVWAIHQLRDNSLLTVGSASGTPMVPPAD